MIIDKEKRNGWLGQHITPCFRRTVCACCRSACISCENVSPTQKIWDNTGWDKFMIQCLVVLSGNRWGTPWGWWRCTNNWLFVQGVWGTGFVLAHLACDGFLSGVHLHHRSDMFSLTGLDVFMWMESDVKYHVTLWNADLYNISVITRCGRFMLHECQWWRSWRFQLWWKPRAGTVLINQET